MKKDLATPRPWLLNGYFIESRGGPDIAEVGISNEHGCHSEYEANANAELIVRAVNNFEALLEALKNIIANDEITNGNIPVELVNQAKQAITNAEK